jgi:signal peptidase II
MVFVVLAAGVFALDQVTKLVVNALMHTGQSIPIINGIFHITYVRNPGAAFGLLAHRTGFFVLATLVVAILILVYYRQLPAGHPCLRAALALQLGGALGNLADRVRLGSVVDFLDFQVWPVFNVADVALVTGVGLLILDLARPAREKGI